MVLNYDNYYNKILLMTKQKNVSRDEVIRIAKLSKLHLNEEQIIKYTHDINQILTYMEQLNEVNIKDVEPLSHVLDQSNVVREDVVAESLDTDQILENAPQSSGKHFVVPKVIEK